MRKFRIFAYFCFDKRIWHIFSFRNHSGMKTDKKLLLLFLLFSLPGIALRVEAQQVGDEFKKKLKKSIKPLESIPIPSFSPKNVTVPIELQHKDKLVVSPTTKLPTIYDHFNEMTNDTIRWLENFNPEFIVTNSKGTDYTDGKVHSIPDARSIMQNAQYTGVGGAGIVFGDLDLDPVRVYKAYKARKRKEKVDKIKRAYNQID